MSIRDQMRKGSTEILLLSLLTEAPMYGYEISQELDKRSGGYFDMKEGLLYPTLHRMQKDGLLTSEWRQAGQARRRKYYTITAKGREQLATQTDEWQTFMEKLQALIGNEA